MIVMQCRKKRRIIMCLVIGIIVGTAGIIVIFAVPQSKKEEIRLYNYTYQPGLTYEVHLIENDIYGDTIQKEDQNYIKKLIDYIEVQFNTSYQASGSAGLDIEYEVKASVVGYDGETENRTDYWSKDFSLVEKKKIHMDTDSYENLEPVKIYPKTYDDFAKQTNELTELTLATELKVNMVGSITATTENGTLVTPIEISMNFPLQGSVVKIAKGSLEQQTDELTKIEIETLPINVKNIILISIGIVFCILCISFLHLFINEPTEGDILQREVKKIINKYGSRMVTLRCAPKKKFQHFYEVYCIKDILIVSDVVQKPIYYVVDEEDIIKEYTFYVEDQDAIYFYNLLNDYETEINENVQSDNDELRDSNMKILDTKLKKIVS